MILISELADIFPSLSSKAAISIVLLPTHIKLYIIATGNSIDGMLFCDS